MPSDEIPPTSETSFDSLTEEQFKELQQALPAEIPSDIQTAEQFKSWWRKIPIPNPIDPCTYLVKVNTLGIQVAAAVAAAKAAGEIRDFEHCMELANATEFTGSALTNGAVGAVAKEMVQCSCKWVYGR